MIERFVLRMKRMILPAAVAAGALIGTSVFASEEVAHAAESGGGHGDFAVLFLWIAVILLAAKLSSLVERWGQPSVLGELVMGVILGNLFLVGIDWFEPIKHSEIISSLQSLVWLFCSFRLGWNRILLR